MWLVTVTVVITIKCCYVCRHKREQTKEKVERLRQFTRRRIGGPLWAAQRAAPAGPSTPAASSEPAGIATWYGPTEPPGMSEGEFQITEMLRALQRDVELVKDAAVSAAKLKQDKAERKSRRRSGVNDGQH